MLILLPSKLLFQTLAQLHFWDYAIMPHRTITFSIFPLFNFYFFLCSIFQICKFSKLPIFFRFFTKIQTKLNISSQFYMTYIPARKMTQKQISYIYPSSLTIPTVNYPNYNANTINFTTIKE